MRNIAITHCPVARLVFYITTLERSLISGAAVEVEILTNAQQLTENVWSGEKCP